MLTQIAKTASGVKYALTADAGNNWYFLGFECQIENQKLQGIDQLHLNKDGNFRVQSRQHFLGIGSHCGV